MRYSATVPYTRTSQRQGSLFAVTRTLAWTDFKLRYAGSALGYFWTVSKPLLLFGVLYVVFTHVLRFGAGIEHYPVMLLFAIVLWTFFTEVTGRGVTVLVGRADVLRKVAIPRMALPLSVTLTGGLITLFNLLAVLVFVVVNDVAPRMSWIWLVPLGAELVALTLGCTLILSVAYVSLRDIGQVWELALQLLFYATPIIYPLSLIHYVWAQKLMLLNPMAQIIQDARYCLISDQTITIGQLYGTTWARLIPVGLVAILVAVSVGFFRRRSPFFAEEA